MSINEYTGSWRNFPLMASLTNLPVFSIFCKQGKNWFAVMIVKRIQ